MTTGTRRLPLAALAFLAAAASPLANAGASDLRMTVEQPHFTCQGHTDRFARVAYHPGERDVAAAPLPCCNGQIGCAQFLSTNTVVRQAHSWHS